MQYVLDLTCRSKIQSIRASMNLMDCHRCFLLALLRRLLMRLLLGFEHCHRDNWQICYLIMTAREFPTSTRYLSFEIVAVPITFEVISVHVRVLESHL